MKNNKPGATGKFPDGKLNEFDEGELAVAVATDKKARRIILNFGKPIKWIALTPEQAEGFADLLIQKAFEFKK